jgi:hypothetical protein
MNIFNDITDREQARRQQITNIYLTNIEDFRIKATKAYSNFCQKDRSTLKSIETDNISSYGILSEWEQNLLPIQKSLISKRSDDSFAKLLTKNLSLNNDEVQLKIEDIISERESEILNNFISQIYLDQKNNFYAEQRHNLKTLLLKSESEIKQIKDHQIDYFLYKEIAMQNNINVVDSHTSIIKRIMANRRINSERKKTIKFENERLIFINNRLKTLSTINGGLMTEVVDNNWDLITIFSLRNQYEKKISKLSENDSENAIKRLEVFDAETQKFKTEQIEKINLSSNQINLETTRLLTKNIDNLLLRIFDLTNMQKNQLLLYSKEYRELNQEQTAINNLQNNRLNY